MKRNGWIIGIVALVIVAVAAAGGYYLLFQNNVQAQVEAQLKRAFANPPPPYTKASYQKLEVALASRRLTIDGIVLERSKPPYTIRISRAEATGIDIDQLQKVFDPAKYGANRPDTNFRPVADTLTLTGIDSDSRDKGRTTADRVVAQGIQAHQFATRPDPDAIAAMDEKRRAALLFDALHFDSVVVDNVTGSSPNDASGKIARIELVDFSRQYLKLLAIDQLDIANSKDNNRVSWKRLEISELPADRWFDYAMTGQKPADPLSLVDLGGFKISDLLIVPGKAGEPTMRVAAFDLGKVTRKRLDHFVLSGVDVRDPAKPDEGVTIGSLEVRDVDWEQLLPLVSNHDFMSRLRDARYRVGKLSVRDFGGPTFDAIGAKLKEVSFSGAFDTDTGKETSTVAIDSFEIDTARGKNDKVNGLLQSLGYDKVTLSMETAGSGDRNAGTSSLDRLRIFGPQVGEFGMSFALTDYKRSPSPDGSHSLDAVLSSLAAARLQGFKVSWRDDSLTGRLLKLAGMQSGATPEQVRDGLITQIKAFAQEYAGSPMVLGAAQALIDYLNKPGLLTIEAKPPKPPELGEVSSMVSNSNPSNVPDMFRLLGLEVTSK